MPLQWLENAYIMRRVAVRTMHSAFFRLASCPRHRTIKPDPLPTMNRNRYRLVFNRHRMQPMAVAECVATHAGESGSRCGAGMVARLPRLCALAAALQLWLGPAVAQIVASSDAPGHQRATVLDAGNGVPLVNVQSPSAAGVSRNTYSRFDVQAQGAILNNSRTAVGTHLAGGVAGNPWMAKGTARIIVNEVVSADPSRLRGIIEVAGDRAEVVIANPAGIDVDGAGFINASRATLTTGVPEFRDGALEGYRVERGRVRIEAGGLDASDTAYADILARAVEVNGAIHASELTVITGANRLSADLERIEPVEGSGEIPAFALDVVEKRPLGVDHDGARRLGRLESHLVAQQGRVVFRHVDCGHGAAAVRQCRVVGEGRGIQHRCERLHHGCGGGHGAAWWRHLLDRSGLHHATGDGKSHGQEARQVKQSAHVKSPFSGSGNTR